MKKGMSENAEVNVENHGDVEDDANEGAREMEKEAGTKYWEK